MQGQVGYWGPPTATLDWCEENYVSSFYIAELWNTISNLSFILFTLFGVLQCWRLSLEWRYFRSYLGITLVGLGSWAFHSTLLYEFQLMDELPMIYATCVFVFCMIENGRRGHARALVVALLVVYAFGVTTIYLWWREPVFHQVAYAGLVLTVVGLCAAEVQQPRSRRLRPLFIASITSYGMGFLLWNLDNALCPQLRAARAALPPMLAPFLQLHSWWHVLTAWGTYGYAVLSTCVRASAMGRPATVQWFGPLPYTATTGRK